MEFVVFKLIMGALVLLLGVLGYAGLVATGRLPRPGLPALAFRPPWRSHSHRSDRGEAAGRDEAAGRLRRLTERESLRPGGQLSAPLLDAPLEETLATLERGFDSFEAGKISLDTFRALVLAEREALQRRLCEVGAYDPVAVVPHTPEDDRDVRDCMTQVYDAVASVEWCLTWIAEFESQPVAA